MLLIMDQQMVENSHRMYFIINLHESHVAGLGFELNPWISQQSDTLLTALWISHLSLASLVSYKQ